MTRHRRTRLAALALAAALPLVLPATTSAASPAGHHSTHHSKPHFTPWTTFGGSPSRSARVTKGVPNARIHPAWHRDLGEVDGEPILVGDTLVVATQGNTVYGLNAATGHTRWQRSLGTPVDGSELECGYLDDLGTISTPAYDPDTQQLFMVAETTGGTHTLWALNPRTGAKHFTRNLDVKAGQDPLTVKNRAAILVTHKLVLVSFGSAGGDCGAYVGYVTSTPTDAHSPTVEYHTDATNNGGMWTPAGPVLGRNGSVYMAVGEGAATSGEWDGADSVVELSPHVDERSAFAPSTWPEDNRDDLDLGSMTPAQLPAIKRQVIAGKAGTVYLLGEHLGGVGSQIASLDGCNAYAGSAVIGNDVVMNCQVNRKTRLLHVSRTGLRWGWTAPAKLVGSPTVAGPHVFVPNRVDGKLYVLSRFDGHVVQRLGLGATTHFPSAAVSGGYVFVNTLSGVSAYR